MKRFIFLLISLVWMTQTSAQKVGELFINNKNVAHEVWLWETFEPFSKLSFFNYTRLRVSYQESSLNEFLSYSTLNYQLGKGWGIATGGFMTATGFSPVVAVSYFYENDIWSVNALPSVEFFDDTNIELFLFLQFRPKLSERFRLFSQLIMSSNFDFRQHHFSEQNLRFGLEYRSFQFGVGAEFTQVPSDPLQEGFGQHLNVNRNFGVFLRKTF
ncbi:MAG: hypothetical protein AAF734_07225 [Bacteroidota bacterium]